jgi:hypothetical protein
MPGFGQGEYQGVYGEALIVPGFALIATYVPGGDQSLPATVQLFAIPSTTTAGTPVMLLWNSLNVAQVEITGTGFTTGLLSTIGSGFYLNESGFAETILLTLTAYNAAGQVILVGGSPLISQTTVTIPTVAVGFGYNFSLNFGVGAQGPY